MGRSSGYGRRPASKNVLPPLKWLCIRSEDGLTIQKSLSFDGKTGRKASLADLFRPGAD
jgi:hypothetical protein